MKKKNFIIVSILISLVIASCYTVSGTVFAKGKGIIIDIPSRKLFLTEDDEIIKEYPVAVGRSRTQTPTGLYSVIYKVIDPYYKKGNVPGGSIYNPLGSRWIGFREHYGIHGNSNPKSIGTFASEGCVRMFERDVQELYEIVGYGVPVKVQYELIKVKKDVDGEDPILVVYPDYYNKEDNLSDKIDSKLHEIELYDKIPQDRTNELEILARKQITVFSDTNAYFVNDIYVTNDVIIDNGNYYVNRRKVENFFNIRFMSIYGSGFCFLWNERVEEKVLNCKKYISIEDLEKLLGGDHSYNKDDRSINYKLGNFIFLNNKIVRGKGLDLIYTPKIPVNTIVDSLNIDIVETEENTRLINNNTELKYTQHGDEYYVSIVELHDKLNIDSNVHTSNKYIELFLDPVIVYKSDSYQGRIIGSKIYVPYSIYLSQKTSSGTTDSNEGVSDDVDIINLNGSKYVNLFELRNLTITKSNEYKTLIYLQRRIY